MRVLLILTLFFISAFSLTLEQSKHLLNRTSFGYTQEQLQIFSQFSKEESVNYLLRNASSTSINKLPSKLKESSLPLKGLDKNQKKQKRKIRNQKFKELQNWWLQMMLEPEFAFREKMTLFWHNHFVSEYKVLRNPYLMYLQNKLYREESIGNFTSLLNKSSKDLSMLIYLDNNSNKKESPNENYAREVLELFTLGEGNYGEEDIKQAAKAFTGWRAKKKNFSFVKVKKLHDNSIKTFMGKRGNFDGEDIINIILQQDRTAIFIVEKLYKEFVSYELDNVLVRDIAAKFRTSNYDIKIAMKELLLSSNFWDSKSQMIKSPLEFTLGLAKHFDYKFDKKRDLFKVNTVAKNLGQELFNPPGVQGWEGGHSWIDVSSLINRQNFIRKILRKQKKNIKTNGINDFDKFSTFFFSQGIKEDIKFKNNYKIYSKYLSKIEYQVK